MKIERYQRHSLIDWFSQDDVMSSKFAIVGCGAVGNEVAKNLALLGIGHIDLFDFDTIEIHNLTRSVLFKESDVGGSKAEVTAKRIKELDPNVEVNFYLGDFWEQLSFSQAKLYDCIICCVDNFEARIRLNQICLLTKTNLINTGIDSKFGQVEVFPFKSGQHVACYECNLPNSTYERMHQRYSCGWLKNISFIERKIPTTIITSSLTGALAVSNALNLIRDHSAHDAKRILIDSFTGNTTVSIIDQSCSCPACSSLGDHIAVVQAKARIESNFNTFSSDPNDHFTTSEPILVSYRCIDCLPDANDEKIVFEKASDYDSTITMCSECGKETVEVNIRDSFSFSYVSEKLLGFLFPCKFVRYDSDNLTTIIELE
jgi:molybdopterin-synthase adenylyltransferase